MLRNVSLYIRSPRAAALLDKYSHAESCPSTIVFIVVAISIIKVCYDCYHKRSSAVMISLLALLLQVTVHYPRGYGDSYSITLSCGEF